MKNAEVVGAHLIAGARALMEKHALIGDVRGRGLMVGIELVRDRQTKERATTERDAVVQECFTRGLLVLGAGRNAIRLSPPLVLTKAAGRHRAANPRRSASAVTNSVSHDGHEVGTITTRTHPSP